MTKKGEKSPRERLREINDLHWQKVETRVKLDPEYEEWQKSHAPHLKKRLERRHGICLKDEPPYGWSLPGIVSRHWCPTDAEEQRALDDAIFDRETLLLEIDLRRLSLKDKSVLAEAVWKFAGGELVTPSCERLTDFEARMEAWRRGEIEPTRRPDTWHNYRPQNPGEVRAILCSRPSESEPGWPSESVPPGLVRSSWVEGERIPGRPHGAAQGSRRGYVVSVAPGRAAVLRRR